MPEAPEVRYMIETFVKPYEDAKLLDFKIKSGRYTRHGLPKNYKNFLKHLPLTIDKVFFKGKGNWITFKKSDFSLYITLNMTGHFTNKESKHTHYHFITNKGTFYLEDMRNFATIFIFKTKEELNEKINYLGLDFYDKKQNTWKHFYEIWEKIPKKKIVCEVLLDQSYYAGIGNYIRAEALYLSKINPFSKISDIDKKHVKILYKSILKILKKSWAEQMQNGFLENTFLVYMLKETKKGEKVKRTPWKGRSVWWVPEVQK